jgi:SWIB/MDM2 domain
MTYRFAVHAVSNAFDDCKAPSSVAVGCRCCNSVFASVSCRSSNVQEPKDRRKIIVDERLGTFLTSPVNMFTMNTQLTKHIFQPEGWAHMSVVCLAPVSSAFTGLATHQPSVTERTVVGASSRRIPSRAPQAEEHRQQGRQHSATKTEKQDRRRGGRR